MLNTFTNPEFRVSEQNFSKKMVRINEVCLYFILDKDDKPNSINENHIANGSFPLSAGQMISLIINLPFIIGDLFGLYDENWLNFINLNQIFHLVSSYFFDNLTLCDLDYKIVEFLKNFKKLYTDSSITPKMHNLTHLTAQMDNFGSFRQHACFRCEAKNGLIKNFGFKNFINICFSVSEKHQFRMASKELEQKIEIHSNILILFVK
jgi:hypothetical protein